MHMNIMKYIDINKGKQLIAGSNYVEKNKVDEIVRSNKSMVLGLNC